MYDYCSSVCESVRLLDYEAACSIDWGLGRTSDIVQARSLELCTIIEDTRLQISRVALDHQNVTNNILRGKPKEWPPCLAYGIATERNTGRYSEENFQDK